DTSETKSMRIGALFSLMVWILSGTPWKCARNRWNQAAPGCRQAGRTLGSVKIAPSRAPSPTWTRPRDETAIPVHAIADPVRRRRAGARGPGARRILLARPYGRRGGQQRPAPGHHRRRGRKRRTRRRHAADAVAAAVPLHHAGDGRARRH